MKEFFEVGKPGYFLLILAFVGCIAALIYLRNGKKRSKQAGNTADAYKVMTEAYLTQVADDKLVNEVIKNLMDKLARRHPDPLITIPKLSHGRNAVYFTWMLVKEVEHNGAESLKKKPACRFNDVGLEGLVAVGAERSAETVRAFLAGDATAQDAEQALAEELPLSLCVEYIRSHTDEFIDE